jgi:hypothetical protein
MVKKRAREPIFIALDMSHQSHGRPDEKFCSLMERRKKTTLNVTERKILLRFYYISLNQDALSTHFLVNVKNGVRSIDRTADISFRSSLTSAVINDEGYFGVKIFLFLFSYVDGLLF